MPTLLEYAAAIAMGDVDGDGDLDLVFGNTGGCAWGTFRLVTNWLYLNDGRGVYSDATSARMPPRTGSTTSLALCDIDDDGDLDLVTGNPILGADFGSPCSLLTQQSWLYLNDGTGTFTDVTTRLPPDEDHVNALAIGDVDGDADLDIVMASGSGQNRVYRNLQRQLAARLPLRPGVPYAIDAYLRYGPLSQSDLAFPALSFGRTSIPFPPFGRLGIDPTTMVTLTPVFIPRTTGIATLTLPTGRANVALPLPSDPGLDRTQLFVQGYVLDPNGAYANALAFSGGLRLMLRRE